LSEYEKWFKRNWKDYSFTKWKKKFGQRLVGKLEGGFWHDNRITLIYNFIEGKPSIEDFASFLKDTARFYNQYEGDYKIDGAFFVVYEEYDKKAFRLLLRRSDVRDIVKIKIFARSQPKSRVSLPLRGTGTKQKKARALPTPQIPEYTSLIFLLTIITTITLASLISKKSIKKQD